MSNKKFIKLCACAFAAATVISSTTIVSNSKNFKFNNQDSIIDCVDATLIGATSGKFAFEVIDESKNTVRLVNGAANAEAIQATNWTIPSTFNYQNKTYTVEQIGTTEVGFDVPVWQRWCFNGPDHTGFNITGKLTLPATVKSIGYCAFQWNNKITEIDLSQCTNLETITTSAFYQGDYSDRVNVDKLIIPANVKTIGSNAFDGVKFSTEIHFTGTTTLPKFETSTFTQSDVKAKVYVPKGMTASYKAITNFPFDTVYEEDSPTPPTPPTPVGDKTINVTLTDGTTTKIDSKYIDGLWNDETKDIVLGDKSIKRDSILSISFSDVEDVIIIENCFLKDCKNLETVDLSGLSNLQAIGDLFLANSPKVKNIILPDSLLTIGNDYLKGNESIENYVFSTPNLKKIGYSFLGACLNVKTVDLSAIKDDVLQYRFNFACESTKLEHIYVDENLVSKYQQAKGWKDHYKEGVICARPEPTEFTFDATLIGGSKGTFDIKLGEGKDRNNCSLVSTSTDFAAQNIDFKGGSFTSKDGVAYKITSIGDAALSNKVGLTGSITIPNTIKTIGTSAFEGCTGINGSLTIGNTVTTIGKAAFKNVGFIGTITIPNSVTSVGQECFYNSKVTIYDLCEHKAMLPYAQGMFDITAGKVADDLKIYVADDMIATYKAAEGWKTIESHIQSKDPGYDLRDKIQDGVILHCFDWKYTDIKAEMENIAKAGFSTVQTSVAQAKTNPNHRDNRWYWVYQPDGFYFNDGNPIGTKSELQDLVNEGKKYGVKVVVDVVANHVDSDTQYVQQELGDKGNDNYHHDVHGSIDWTDRFQVTHGEIGMPDLKTESSYVQGIVRKYIQELKDIGVAGIRWDAAKHIGLPSEGDGFWQNALISDMYNYGEILKAPDDRDSGNEGLMKEYTNYMTVTDSVYSMNVRESINSRQAPTSFGNWVARGINNNKLIYWGESHDNFCNNDDWGSSRNMSQDVIDRAYALAAAHNDITALYFSRPGSNDKDSIHTGEKGSTHFKEKVVAEVNKFHNAMCGKADYYNAEGNAVSVTRQGGGALVVNVNGSGYVNAKNGGSYAVPGKYIDKISGNEFTITTDSISGNVGDTGVAVLYNKPTHINNAINTNSTNYAVNSYNLPIAISNKAEYYIANKH